MLKIQTKATIAHIKTNTFINIDKQSIEYTQALVIIDNDLYRVSVDKEAVPYYSKMKGQTVDVLIAATADKDYRPRLKLINI